MSSYCRLFIPRYKGLRTPQPLPESKESILSAWSIPLNSRKIEGALPEHGREYEIAEKYQRKNDSDDKISSYTQVNRPTMLVPAALQLQMPQLFPGHGQLKLPYAVSDASCCSHIRGCSCSRGMPFVPQPQW